MRTKRNVPFRNLALAAALALTAALLTSAYVARAGGGETAEAAAGSSVTVYVAKHDVETGTAGAKALADDLLVPRTLPREAVVPGAVTAPAQISSLVAVQPLFAGEQATTRRFGSVSQQGVRTQLRGTMRVLAVPGTPDQLLAGTLAPGDHVDVVASLKRGDTQTAFGRVVLRDLLVLRAPDPDAAEAAGSADALSATLRLTDAQAQKLFFVIENGDWAFALRPANGAGDSATRLESADTVLGGS